MDSLLGKWKLKRNNDFNTFLIFRQTSWFARTNAENSSINVEIKKTDDKTYHKSIDSLFYNTEESITLDNTFKLYDKIQKRYSYNDNKIITDIVGTIVNWTENIFLNDKKQLVIEYVWSENENEQHATQVFDKN